jgi:predicted RNA-binding protein with PIN domain
VYILDGYNLALGSLAFSMARDRGGLAAVRDALFEAVARDCERRSTRVVIVWDGTERFGAPTSAGPVRGDPRGVEESFSRAPEKADERVIALALETRGRGEAVVVVSDDQEVREDAVRAGLDWIGDAAFEERLFEPLERDPHAHDEGRHARRVLAVLVAAGFVDDPGAGAERLIAELGDALAYAGVQSGKPHKRAKSATRWLREYGVPVRGEAHEHRALLVPLFE